MSDYMSPEERIFWLRWAWKYADDCNSLKCRILRRFPPMRRLLGIVR